MLRDDGWRVIAIGRNIERIVALVSAAEQVALSPHRDEPALLEWLLDLSDATVTYRARYRSLPDWAGVVDLLVYDETNPRSASYLLAKLVDHTRRLPEAGLETLTGEIAAAARRAKDARGGTLFTRRGKLRIGDKAHQRDDTPVDVKCGCYTCRNYSKMVLRHLHYAHEPVFETLASIHNLQFYEDLMASCRHEIERGRFGPWKEAFLRRYGPQEQAPAAARSRRGGRR